MTNIVLFILSVAGYFVAWVYLTPGIKVTAKGSVKNLGIIVLMCLPVNIGGNVFTLMGNAQAEKSVYSIFSMYQKAHENTIAAVAFSQNAGGTAANILGIGEQNAGENAFSLAGIVFQRAGGDAVLGGGVAAQETGSDATIGVGFAPFQRTGRDATVGIGLGGYQHSKGIAIVGMGAGLYQHADKGSAVGIGLGVYQQGGLSAQTEAGIGLYQQVPGKERAFGVWSELVAEPTQE